MAAPALAYRNPLGGRGYKHPTTGQKVPSITTITGCLDKPVLVPAAAKLNAEWAVKNWDELSALDESSRVDLIKGRYRKEWFGKADLGTRVHEVAEAWAKDTPLPQVSPDMEGMVRSLLQFLDDYCPEFSFIEATVWSEQYEYAGTLDFTAMFDGVSTFGDYKTGARVYPEIALQIAAAVNADYIITPDGETFEVPRCDRAVGVNIRPQGYTVHDVNLDGAFQAFLGLRSAYRWKQREDDVLRAVPPMLRVAS